jgi:UrcA family protein
MTRFASTFALAASALLLAAASQPCVAQSRQLYNGYSNDPGRVVTYTRIHLSRSEMQTAAGARNAVQEIEAAADAVCGGEVHARVSLPDYEACRREAEDNAVRRLGRAAVTAALAERRRGAQQAAQ